MASPKPLQRVFLCYCRYDDARFVRRLYDDLSARGFQVWFDRESLPSRQLTFHQEIADAIRTETDRLVYVAGPRAAASDYVRQEWRYALEWDRPVIPIQRLGALEEILPGELSLFHCDDFRDDTIYARQFEKLVANLIRTEPPLATLHCVPNLPLHFLGRPELLNRVRDALRVDLQKPRVISGSAGIGTHVGLQGMGGIGKSVLAAAVARDRQLRRAYPDGVIWMTVGSKPNLLASQARLARLLGGTEAIASVDQGKNVLEPLLAAKAVLLILDDVWDVRDIEAIAPLGPRGRALVTTRDGGILEALAAKCILVELLTEFEALQLLTESASATGRDPLSVADLPSVAHEVVRRCGLLPLAIALSGGMIRAGATWVEILEAFERAALEEIRRRQLRDGDNPHHRTLWAAMLASVDHLGDPDKQRRFAELAAFATDRATPEAAVAALWGKTGGLSSVAVGNLLREFSERSMIQLNQDQLRPGATPLRRIALHDLLHDCATRLVGDPVALHHAMISAYRARCEKGWASGPNDGYFFENLVRHLVLSERSSDAHGLLLDYSWIETKLRTVGIVGTLDDYEELSPTSLEPAGLVKDALRLSAHVLDSRPEELPTQLVGRLLKEDDESLADLIGQIRSNLSKPSLIPAWPSYDAPRGALLRTFDTGAVVSLALSADGLTLATCDTGPGKATTKRAGGIFPSDKSIRLWEVRSGRLLRTFGNGVACSYAALSADGMTIAGSLTNAVEVWDARSGTLLRRISSEGEIVTSIALDASGRLVAIALANHGVNLWEVCSGNLLRTVEGNDYAIYSARLSADGQILAGCMAYDARLWDATTGRLLHAFRGHMDSVLSVALTADGQTLASGSADKTIKLWDTRSGRLLRTLEGHSDVVRDVAVSRDGQIVASASVDKTVKLWDAQSGRLQHTLDSHSHWVYRVALSADGQTIASSSADQTVKLWAPGRMSSSSMRQGHTDWVKSVALSADGQTLLSGSTDKTVRLWEVASGDCLRTFQGHEGWVVCVALSADGRTLASASWHNVIKLWNIDSTRAVTLKSDRHKVSSVALSPDGRYLVCSGFDTTIKLWNVSWLRALSWPRIARRLTATGKPHWVNSVALSSDAHTLAGAWENTIKLWDIRSRRLLRTIEGHAEAVSEVALSADGQTVASSSLDGTIRLWEARSGRLLRTLDSRHPNWALSMVLSADGQIVAASWGRVVELWDSRLGSLIASATCEADVHALALSRTGQRLAAGDQRGRLYIFDLCPGIGR